MVLKVKNVAHLVGNEIIVTDPSPVDFATILAKIEPNAGSGGPAWVLPLVIGEGSSRRAVRIELSTFLTHEQFEKSLAEPIRFISNDAVIFVLFKNRFFIPERNPTNDREREELTLRVKRAVYKDEEELNALKSYVSNVEATVQYERDGPQRIAISADVKLLVWTRDGGACVRCGSREKLHFDHIIPVAKGGGNDPKNIQILCEPCNLKKSDKIAF